MHSNKSTTQNPISRTKIDWDAVRKLIKLAVFDIENRNDIIFVYTRVVENKK